MSNQNSKYLNLAVRYRKRHNPKRAIYYYKMAVKQGCYRSMNNLGIIYKNQFKNFKKAIEYYKMAIEKGNDVLAMDNLAELYEEEYQDYAKAQKYYEMALENGYEKAREKLDRIKKGSKR